MRVTAAGEVTEAVPRGSCRGEPAEGLVLRGTSTWPPDGKENPELPQEGGGKTLSSRPPAEGIPQEDVRDRRLPSLPSDGSGGRGRRRRGVRGPVLRHTGPTVALEPHLTRRLG